MKKKVIIAAGGTGGHVFPSIALGHALKSQGMDVLFVGGGLKNNKYFDHALFAFKEVSCGRFSEKNPLKLVYNGFMISKGVLESLHMLRLYQADCLVGFGSYYTFPTLVAARLAGIPIVLHEANAIPGKVNRLFSKHAQMTGIHFSMTAKYLKGQSIEVGMPLRVGFKKGSHNRRTAYSYFGLDADKKTLLIFGGSQGAKILNHCLSQAIKNLPEDTTELQVMHFTGAQLSADEIASVYKDKGIKACVKPFETRMDLAWEIADLLISRAGASTLAEQIEYEVPAILIPYPYATDNHQEYNADFVVSIGGAIKILETALTNGGIELTLHALLAKESLALMNMRLMMQAYKEANKPAEFAQVITTLLEGIK